MCDYLYSVGIWESTVADTDNGHLALVLSTLQVTQSVEKRYVRTSQSIVSVFGANSHWTKFLQIAVEMWNFQGLFSVKETRCMIGMSNCVVI